MTESKINKKSLFPTLFLLMYLMVSWAVAQNPSDEKEPWEPQQLSRGKLWMGGLPNGDAEYAISDVRGFAYPGFTNVQAGMGSLFGNRSNTPWITGIVNGEMRNLFMSDNSCAPINEAGMNAKLVKNYNFSQDITMPEEYIIGTGVSDYYVPNEGGFAMKWEATAMVWSQLKYDDFIIYKNKVTNLDTYTIEDMYIGRDAHWYGNQQGGQGRSAYDNEYLWDPELGFVIYDERQYLTTTEQPVEWSIPPGDRTGDAGDPGNIGTIGSINYQLYSPQLYAQTYYNTPVNKNGEQKIYRFILSNRSEAPAIEKAPNAFRDASGEGGSGGRDLMHSDLTSLIAEHAQPEKSWKQARADGEIYGGSIYERIPAIVTAIGPYDLAPGESLEWIEVLICGEMDRNITMKGGYEATENYVQKGYEAIVENWANCKELIENNFQIVENVPPPTPANTPLIGNDLVLESELFGSAEEGAGIILKFEAVHVGYTDPLTGEADFDAYKIYRSDVGILGPWEVIKTVSLAEAEANTVGDQVSIKVIADTGVPFRYAVTTVDKYGNESGRTAYLYYTVAAPIAPSNELSKVRVVPNPFRQFSGFLDPGEYKRLAFINIPAQSTIRIYNLAGALVKTIKHDGFGEETWGTSSGDNYMLTDFGVNVQPGIYIYHVENNESGHEGEAETGKFAIIK